MDLGSGIPSPSINGSQCKGSWKLRKYVPSKWMVPSLDESLTISSHSWRSKRKTDPKSFHSSSISAPFCSRWPHFEPLTLTPYSIWMLIVLMSSFFMVCESISSSSSSSSTTSSSSPFEGESISSRTVNTKYGSLRGIVVHFKNPSFPASSPTSSSSKNLPPYGSSGSSSPSSSAQGKGPSSTSSSFFPNSTASSWPNLKGIEVFLGVPYATPPIGSLRFMPPVTPTHWRGVRLANRFGPVCPQKMTDINFKPGSSRASSSPSFSSTSSSASGSSSSSTSSSSSSGSSSRYKSSFGTSGFPHYNSAGSGSSSSSSSSGSSMNHLPEFRIGHLKRMASFLRNQSEDCLYLNIYAPLSPASSSPSSSSSSGSSSSSSSSAQGNKPLVPVMVFIHGESFDWGSGNSYDGSILSSFGNVVVITLNYRLGLFGFLPASVDGASRGNYGLMDQVAALHWISENIAEFGGDPANVTLVGHGIGAACVNLLMISPMTSSTLFSRVILMSGSALSPGAIAKDSDSYSKLLAKSLNCPTYDNVVMVDCLRGKPMEELLNVDLKVPEHLTAFGPIVDGIVIPAEPRTIIAPDNEYPYNGGSSSYSKGSSAGPSGSSGSLGSGLGTNAPPPYDVLFGITRVEAPPAFSSLEEKQGIDLIRRDRILRTLVRNLFDYHQQVIFLTLINEYTDWSRPVEHPINLLESLADILGDALVVAPLIQSGDSNVRSVLASSPFQQSSGSGSHSGSSSSSFRRHNHQRNPFSSGGSASSSSSSSSSSLSGLFPPADTRTFFYVFSYQNQENDYERRSSYGDRSSNRFGCQHGDELNYVFGAPLSQDVLGRSLGHFSYNFSRHDLDMTWSLMTYWTNFAKFGDPNIWPHELDSLGDRAKGRFENVYWPQYDNIQRKYLMIGMKPKVRDHYHSHRLSYWMHLVPRLQLQPQQQQQQNLLPSWGDGGTGTSVSQSVLENEQHQHQVYYYKHHLLPDHENMDSYDGIVRQISFRFPVTHSVQGNSSSFKIGSRNHAINSVATSPSLNGDDNDLSKSSNKQVLGHKQSSSSSSSVSDLNSPPSHPPMNTNGMNKSTLSTPMVMEQGTYSTALSVTIAIGCSLLVLNMLIFAGVYYQLDRAKNKDDRNKNGRSQHDSPISGSCPNGTNGMNGSGCESSMGMTVHPGNGSGTVIMDSNGTIRRSRLSQHHIHHSPRHMSQYQFQEVLPLTQEEIILLSQKEGSHPYTQGTVDKNTLVSGSVSDDVMTMTPTDLDMYSSNHHHATLHHHMHQHPHHTLQSAGSDGRSHHQHVHFVHTHVPSVQMMDSSDPNQMMVTDSGSNGDQRGVGGVGGSGGSNSYTIRS